MSLYILDTDHVSLHQRGHLGLASRVRAVAPDSLAVTIITVEEQMSGRLAQIGRQGQDAPLAYSLLLRTLRYFCDLPILHFDQTAQQDFKRLRGQGIRIGTLDLRIAAIALALGATLVTRNQADFGQVPDLTTEDWTLPT
jgi:tRNA(fMet)-specific endonuclease VapC